MPQKTFLNIYWKSKCFPRNLFLLASEYSIKLTRTLRKKLSVFFSWVIGTCCLTAAPTYYSLSGEETLSGAWWREPTPSFDVARRSPGECVSGVVHNAVKVIDFSQRVHLPGLHLQKVVLLSCDFRRTRSPDKIQRRGGSCKLTCNVKAGSVPRNTQLFRNLLEHISPLLEVRIFFWFYFRPYLAECCPWLCWHARHGRVACVHARIQSRDPVRAPQCQTCHSFSRLI